MPQSLSIAAFVFGSVLILLSLVVGKFKLFGAEVEGTVGKVGRIIAFFFGVFLIGTGLNLDGSHPAQPQAGGQTPVPVPGGQPVVEAKNASVTGSLQQQSSPAQYFDNFILGAWQARAADPYTGIVSDTVMRFMNNGSFSGTESGLVNGVPMSVPFSGTWSARPVSSDRFMLTVNYLGRGGAQSYTFRVLDHNSVENEEMNYVAHRVSE